MGPAGPFFFEKDRFSGKTGERVATTHEKERQLQEDIAPRVASDLPGVEVLAVELRSPDHFTVYVDRPEGVDLALCERVSGLLRDYTREYSVDVSSPGPERPLRTPAHFARVVGRRVKLRTRTGKLKGEVVAAGDTHVTVDENEIPYENIVRANLIDER
jgi:ribosome maturation factor RimP